jgi:hypothetical protein
MSREHLPCGLRRRSRQLANWNRFDWRADSRLDVIVVGGGTILLFFWTGRSKLCLAWLAQLKATQALHVRDGLTVVGIHLGGTDPAEASKVVEEAGVTFPVVLDTKGGISKAYLAPDVPAFFLIDRLGKLRRADFEPKCLEPTVLDAPGRSPDLLDLMETVSERIRAMPIISMFYGIIIRLYLIDNKQHRLPHIHARYAEFEASISIADGEILAGELPRKQLRLVQAWIELRRDELQADWELAIEGEVPYKIAPL